MLPSHFLLHEGRSVLFSVVVQFLESFLAHKQSKSIGLVNVDCIDVVPDLGKQSETLYFILLILGTKSGKAEVTCKEQES